MPRFLPMPTEVARACQAGGVDSHALLPERRVSDGGGNPCRHCLRMIPEGKGMLVLAHRPFGTGGVVPTGRIVARAEELLVMPGVAFLHVRSARNNCFQVRIERG